MLYLVTLLVALQIADAWTTVVILQRGGRELNPLLCRLMDKIGPLPALVLSKLTVIGIVILLGVYLMRHTGSAGVALFALLDAVCLFVVARHAVIIMGKP